ncbi:MAG: hypothetical protein KA204_03850, partial [Chromatiaceae bacterium]|nr:hypothetical protein [Chromatiaceae bacterium]
MSALPTMQTEMNAWAGQANSTASETTNAVGDAEAAQAAAEAAQAGAEAAQGTATTQAGIATTQAGIATTQAGTATTQAGIATTQAGIATTQAGIATTKAGEAAASAALAVDVVSGGLTSTTPAANKIPLADGAAKIALGWLDLTGYAPAADGVTNGNSHDHNGGDGAQIAYASLSGLPTLGTAAATASSNYAPAAQGVTNGNSHDHNGGDGGQIAYANLSGLPTLGTAAATASSNYAPAAQGVTNGNSHDHNGGDGAQIAYASLSGLPTLGTAAATASSDYASASHAHGNITAAGAIGSTANLPVITTTSGALTVGAFGTGATNFTAGNDARLSDARTPTAHNQAETTITFTDVSTGNASTTKHGFSPKATAPASGLRSVMAIDNGETVRSDKALFDATDPAALGTASPGSAMTAARRDHVHPLPSVSEKLTAARTYYVRTDGNDANTGLANTSGGAFLTIQKAIDVARSFDLSLYNITIAVGAGTFVEALLCGPYTTGGGYIAVQGTAGSTAIDLATGNCIEGSGVSVWLFSQFILSTDDGEGFI